jgi:hypothetical protein
VLGYEREGAFLDEVCGLVEGVEGYAVLKDTKKGVSFWIL